MNIYADTSGTVTASVDVLVFLVPEGTDVAVPVDYPAFERVTAATGDMIAGLVAETGRFRGKRGQFLPVQTHGKLPQRRIILAGTGVPAELTPRRLQELAAGVIRKAHSLGATHVRLEVPAAVSAVLSPAAVGEALATGIRLGSYTFERYKKPAETPKPWPNEVGIAAEGGPQLAAGVKQGVAVAEAVVFARDLVNEPPSLTTPVYLAGVARELAKTDKRLSCEVLGKSEMEQLGMGALLAIARGSRQEPQFIVLRYKGGGKKTVALVGKGITFDTGGLSLKSPDNMETMKLDMAGAAAVMGVFRALPVFKPDLNVVGLLAVTENMPGPDAVKPGDIVTAMNGTSIEILNTDAEGRVVLADAMSYAGAKIKPDVIIDVATLTGACMIALGTDVAGLFSSDRQLAQALLGAADRAGEQLWELPLVGEYRKLLDTQVADIKNIAGRYGGAITGALFIQEFVPANTPWAHLDIAGPSFAEKEQLLSAKGGTGYGVRLLLEYLSEAQQDQEK